MKSSPAREPIAGGVGKPPAQRWLVSFPLIGCSLLRRDGRSDPSASSGLTTRPAVVTQFETALQSNAVIPSAARFLRPGWVCGARDLLFASGRQNFKLSHYPSGTPEGGCPPGFLARMSLTATMLVRSTRC